jgi:hypothetical protein
MKLLKNTVRLIKRRPLALLFMGIVMMVYAIIDSYNPILPIFLGLGSITEGGISEGILSLLQFMIDPDIIPMIILLIFSVSGIGALVLGFVLSGYCYTINNGIAGKKKFKGEFIAGLKKYFLKLTWVSFRVIFIGILLIIFLLVASVPALIITNVADISKPKLLAAAFLMNVITAGVIFFAFMYFRAYMFFWYPAAVNQAERPFTAGIRAANRNFWGITGRFLTFDIFFIVFALILRNIDSSLYRIIATWIFGTFYVVLFSAYIFFAFKIYNIANKGD